MQRHLWLVASSHEDGLIHVLLPDSCLYAIKNIKYAPIRAATRSTERTLTTRFRPAPRCNPSQSTVQTPLCTCMSRLSLLTRTLLGWSIYTQIAALHLAQVLEQKGPFEVRVRMQDGV